MLTAAYSLNGTQWVDLQANPNLAEIFAAADGPVYVGALGANGSIEASYDYIRFTPDEDCPDQCHPLSDQFGGSELDSKWELVNANATSQPGVEDGHLTLPLVPGDLFGGNGNAQMLLQQAPAGSWVATAKIAHANIDTNGEAAGLALINRFDPNHFVKTAVQYKSDTDPNTPGDQPGKWAERVLTANGNAVTIPPETVPWPNSGALNLTGDYVWVRFVHDATANTITTWTSTNGTSFTQFGQPIPVGQYLSQPGGLRVGLFGKHDGSGDDEVQVDAFNVVAGRRPADTGRRLRRRRRVPAERRVRRLGARQQVGGRQPEPGGPDRRRRQPDADHRPGRRLRGELHGPEHPPAGGAGGPVDGHDEAQPHGDHGQRPGGRAGALRPAEPELLRQGDVAVQDRRRSRHPGQPAREVDRADADQQQHPERQLRRQLPELAGH